MAKLDLELDPAPGESAQVNQRALVEFELGLRKAGIAPGSRVMLRKGIGFESPLLGEFLVEIIPELKDWADLILPLLAGYLAGRHGRKVRMKLGDREFEATSVTEIERLIALSKNEGSGDRGPEDTTGRE